MTLIQCAEVHKSFGAVRALNDFSLAMQAGEFVGLLGPNGAGKTTAIHLLLGLLTPDAGDVRVFGLSPVRQRTQVVRRLNFASAYTTLPSNLTVRENLRIFARLYGVREVERKIATVLELFDLGTLRQTVAGRLSSGEQMRLSLAKSLLNDPELLLLDEPTLSLDPYRAETVRQLLTRIHQERRLSILYTSHNMREVEALCHRICFLHRGRLIADGSSEDIKRQFNADTLDEVFIRVAQSGELVTKEEPRHA